MGRWIEGKRKRQKGAITSKKRERRKQKKGNKRIRKTAK